ncbi:MAG: hypothetical protein M9928_04860 [Anaerolineae bacterium]|nr:hypothetical protein [Anaerolineae bacterium]
MGNQVPGLAFFALSLVHVGERRSYPIMVEQMVRTQAEKATAKAKREAKKKRKKKETGSTQRQ